MDDFVIETPRLFLSKVTIDDSAFILELLNDPDFIHYIGDKGVKSLDAARQYLIDGPIKSYAEHGFGMYRISLKSGSGHQTVSIGMCGLLKRPFLKDVDIGFAMLPAFRGNGYASEASSEVLIYAKKILKLKRIIAVTAPDNNKSMRLLQNLGFEFEKNMTWPGDLGEVKVFSIEI